MLLDSMRGGRGGRGMMRGSGEARGGGTMPGRFMYRPPMYRPDFNNRGESVILSQKSISCDKIYIISKIGAFTLYATRKSTHFLTAINEVLSQRVEISVSTYVKVNAVTIVG